MDCILERKIKEKNRHEIELNGDYKHIAYLLQSNFIRNFEYSILANLLILTSLINVKNGTKKCRKNLSKLLMKSIDMISKRKILFERPTEEK